MGILGAAAFQIMVPLGCLCALLGLFWNPKVMRNLAVKITVLGLALFVTIPVSIRISDFIYDSHRASIENTISAADELSDETSALSDADEDGGLISSILDHLSETANGLSDKAAKMLNRYIESLAVLIVTSCIIPVLALAFFLWLVKLLTGADVLRMLHRSAGPSESKPEQTE